MNKIEKYLSKIENDFYRISLTNIYLISKGIVFFPSTMRLVYNESEGEEEDYGLYRIPQLLFVAPGHLLTALFTALSGNTNYITPLPGNIRYVGPLYLTNAISLMYELYKYRKSFDPKPEISNPKSETKVPQDTLETKVEETTKSQSLPDPWSVEFPRLEELSR